MRWRRSVKPALPYICRSISLVLELTPSVTPRRSPARRRPHLARLAPLVPSPRWGRRAIPREFLQAQLFQSQAQDSPPVITLWAGSVDAEVGARDARAYALQLRCMADHIEHLAAQLDRITTRWRNETVVGNVEAQPRLREQLTSHGLWSGWEVPAPVRAEGLLQLRPEPAPGFDHRPARQHDIDDVRQRRARHQRRPAQRAVQPACPQLEFHAYDIGVDDEHSTPPPRAHRVVAHEARSDCPSRSTLMSIASVANPGLRAHTESRSTPPSWTDVASACPGTVKVRQ